MSPQDILDAARLAAEALVLLVPAPVAKQLIDDATVRRGHAIRESIEDVRFGPEEK